MLIALEILQSWDREQIQTLVNALNVDGIVSDEDEMGLSSSMIEKWAEVCEDYLRIQGYQGGEIRRCGKFFEGHGAIYAIYDSSALGYEESLQSLASSLS